MTRRRLLTSVVVAVALAAAVAACGVPRDDAPRQIAAADLEKFGLRSSTTTVPASSGHFDVTLYFLSGDRLAKVTRAVADSSVDAALTALLAGALPDDGGVRSAIPAGTRLVSTRSEDQVLVVELTNEIVTAVQGQEQLNAFAQLVFTASDLNGVFGVQVVVNGAPVAIPTDNGAISDRPVYSTDFESLKPG